MDQSKTDAIKAMLADRNDPVKASEIAQVAQAEEKRLMSERENAAAPQHPIPSDEEWAAYKAFLLDGDGNDAYIPAYREVLFALKEDRKADFLRARDLWFKRQRLAFYGQFEL